MSATVGQPEDGRGDAVCDSVTTCTVDSGQWTVEPCGHLLVSSDSDGNGDDDNLLSVYVRQFA